MNMHDICIRLLTTARVGLMFDAPFFGGLAMRMTLHPDEKCSDMRGRFFDLSYNPAYVRSLTPLIIRNRVKLEIFYLLEERMIGDTPRSRVRQYPDSKPQAGDESVLAAVISTVMVVNCAGIPDWIVNFLAENTQTIRVGDQFSLRLASSLDLRTWFAD